jgi:hypothetical protein
MNTETHPELETLRRYLRDIDAPEFDDLRLHLAQCAACRDEVSALGAVEQFYVTLENFSVSEAQQQQISDYIDGRLASPARSEAEALIHGNDAALKAALHYASHSAAMSAALGENAQAQVSAVSEQTVTVNTGLFNWLGRWLDLRAPVWAVIPATAFAVAVVAISLQTFFSAQPTGYTVAAYQDNPVMQFRKNEDLPGIGFFSKAGRYAKDYNQVQVEIIDDTRIRMNWPSVENAANYSMRLQLFDQNQKSLVGEITTEQPTATFTPAELNEGRRYEWILSGKTRDDITFYTNGGFVINKPDQAR